MKLYLSSVFNSSLSKDKMIDYVNECNILHSFAYHKECYLPYYYKCKSLLLDSGAFTFMNAKNKKNNFDPLGYTKKYAKHIKDNNIDLFLEMDIEGVYGFDVYRDCLHCLQDITGKEPIYVFHKWRGLNYYKELVKQKNYIALGDVSVDNKSRELYKFFPWFIEEAHRNNCKVHGLAFTSLKELQFMNFDSVDSSVWTASQRFGRCARFDGHSIKVYDERKNNDIELIRSNIVLEHDFLEWKKLSQYFDTEMEPVW